MIFISFLILVATTSSQKIDLETILSELNLDEHFTDDHLKEYIDKHHPENQKLNDMIFGDGWFEESQDGLVSDLEIKTEDSSETCGFTGCPGAAGKGAYSFKDKTNLCRTPKTCPNVVISDKQVKHDWCDGIPCGHNALEEDSPISYDWEAVEETYSPGEGINDHYKAFMNMPDNLDYANQEESDQGVGVHEDLEMATTVQRFGGCKRNINEPHVHFSCSRYRSPRSCLYKRAYCTWQSRLEVLADQDPAVNSRSLRGSHKYQCPNLYLYPGESFRYAIQKDRLKVVFDTMGGRGNTNAFPGVGRSGYLVTCATREYKCVNYGRYLRSRFDCGKFVTSNDCRRYSRYCRWGNDLNTHEQATIKANEQMGRYHAPPEYKDLELDAHSEVTSYDVILEGEIDQVVGLNDSASLALEKDFTDYSQDCCHKSCHGRSGVHCESSGLVCSCYHTCYDSHVSPQSGNLFYGHTQKQADTCCYGMAGFKSPFKCGTWFQCKNGTGPQCDPQIRKETFWDKMSGALTGWHGMDFCDKCSTMYFYLKDPGVSCVVGIVTGWFSPKFGDVVFSTIVYLVGRLVRICHATQHVKTAYRYINAKTLAANVQNNPACVCKNGSQKLAGSLGIKTPKPGRTLGWSIVNNNKLSCWGAVAGEVASIAKYAVINLFCFKDYKGLYGGCPLNLLEWYYSTTNLIRDWRNAGKMAKLPPRIGNSRAEDVMDGVDDSVGNIKRDLKQCAFIQLAIMASNFLSFFKKLIGVTAVKIADEYTPDTVKKTVVKLAGGKTYHSYVTIAECQLKKTVTGSVPTEAVVNQIMKNAWDGFMDDMMGMFWGMWDCLQAAFDGYIAIIKTIALELGLGMIFARLTPRRVLAKCRNLGCLLGYVIFCAIIQQGTYGINDWEKERQDKRDFCNSCVRMETLKGKSAVEQSSSLELGRGTGIYQPCARCVWGDGNCC